MKKVCVSVDCTYYNMETGRCDLSDKDCIGQINCSDYEMPRMSTGCECECDKDKEVYVWSSEADNALMCEGLALLLNELGDRLSNTCDSVEAAELGKKINEIVSLINKIKD